MFKSRKIESASDWLDGDGIKLYTISATGQPVDTAAYHARLAEVKLARSVDWASTPAFAIFHDGAGMAYLVLCWWGNDNELFNSVSVLTGEGWVEDPSRFSFCLWDLEVIWHERNAFIDTLYSGRPDIQQYRASRLRQDN
ncbi:hypothetical protein ACFOZ5_13300 [Marinobacter lacisalsi]|uniref:DUF3291 domain-containing protein n=1 Tax=Marinobacter lacisalsi TaxID=475979 RepID=A0ABV8QI63_9GAMM